MSKELHKLDLYGILGVEDTASEKEIVKGYRKKALKCHPDKNPDNPKAAEQFHQLSEALEILTDAAARAAYDRSRKARKESELRNQALDSKRKKFKEDLEVREQAAEEKLKAQKTAAAEKNLLKEVERLRKEGSRLLQEEQERLRQELNSNRSEQKKPCRDETDIPRIKLKWKAAKEDLSNGGYNESTLTNIFSCYGHVSSLIISSKRNGSAIIEFEPSGVSSEILEEKGLTETPLTILWLSGKPSQDVSLEKDRVSENNAPLFEQAQSAFDAPQSGHTSFSGVCFSNGSSGDHRLQTASSGDKDFESLVMMKMRQAEERKRLIAQMQKEDEENG